MTMELRGTASEERLASLEKHLAAAQAGEAAAQFELIVLQHRDLQQQDRCDELEKTVQKVNLELQSLHSDLRKASDSPSDEDSDAAESPNAIQLRCHKARLALLEAEIDSLRASRDSLLSMRPAGGGGVPAEMQLQSLLRYTQELEALLDTCTPSSSSSSSRIPNGRLLQINRDFLQQHRSQDVPLKARLSKAQLERHAVETISNASTSIGTRSVQSFSEDASPTRCLPSNEGDASPTRCLSSRSSGQDFLSHGSISLQPPLQNQSPSHKKKVEQRVRFRPQLRMHRDRSTSPAAKPKQGRSLRRSSSKEKTQQDAEESASSWSLPDFTAWYDSGL